MDGVHLLIEGEFDRFEERARVGVVAEGLFGTQPARAPEVGFGVDLGLLDLVVSKLRGVGDRLSPEQPRLVSRFIENVHSHVRELESVWVQTVFGVFGLRGLLPPLHAGSQVVLGAGDGRGLVLFLGAVNFEQLGRVGGGPGRGEGGGTEQSSVDEPAR